MGNEIERKFLVRGDGWREAAARHVPFRQGYLSSTGRSAVRVRLAADRAFFTIKSAVPGVERQEFEYPIPVDDAGEMLDSLCEGTLIEKTRHFVEHGGRTWEVDEFAGENAGLIVAEIELSDADEAFERPEWLGEEVSGDKRYYNAALARHPFREWGAG